MSMDQVENMAKGMRKSCLSKVPIDARKHFDQLKIISFLLHINIIFIYQFKHNY